MALALALPSFTAGFVAPAAVPSLQQARSAVTMGVETELGATGPLGYWDPLGLVRRGAAQEEMGAVCVCVCSGNVGAMWLALRTMVRCPSLSRPAGDQQAREVYALACGGDQAWTHRYDGVHRCEFPPAGPRCARARGVLHVRGERADTAGCRGGVGMGAGERQPWGGLEGWRPAVWWRRQGA